MKTVIEMAREVYGENTFWTGPQLERLERFAGLVRKDYSFTHAQMWLKRFDDAILTEREACAKAAEASYRMGLNVTSQPAHIAAVIRARS